MRGALHSRPQAGQRGGDSMYGHQAMQPALRLPSAPAGSLYVRRAVEDRALLDRLFYLVVRLWRVWIGCRVGRLNHSDGKVIPLKSKAYGVQVGPSVV